MKNINKKTRAELISYIEALTKEYHSVRLKKNEQIKRLQVGIRRAKEKTKKKEAPQEKNKNFVSRLVSRLFSK